MSDNKIVKYKKPFQPRVATMILLLVIGYIVIVAWNYFHKEHISIYEVNETSIADDSTLTGLIIRNEKVFYSEESGYVNFYHADQSKVAKREVIYTIDSSGSVSDLLQNMQTDTLTTQEDISNMRSVIYDFYSNYNSASYYHIKDFHYNVENTVFEQSRDNLYSDFKKMLSTNNISGDFVKYRANAPGIISYSIDGFEETTQESVTADLFKKSTAVERKQLSSSEKIDKDIPVYKLVLDEDWKIIIPLTEDFYDKIKDESVLRITVKKDQISFNANLEIQNNGGVNFAVLSSSRFMARYLNERFLDVELNLNSASGFKIPNSSILTKEVTVIPETLTTTGGDGAEKGVLKLTSGEDGSINKQFTSLSGCYVSDGNYYVDESIIKPGDQVINPANNEAVVLQNIANMEGVYCVNTGYCQFKKIEKKYENNEYTIISSNTTGGLSNYDHIVVNPEQLNENDFVE